MHYFLFDFHCINKIEKKVVLDCASRFKLRFKVFNATKNCASRQTHPHPHIYIYIKSSQARQLYNTSTPLDPQEYSAVLNIFNPKVLEFDFN